MLLHACRFMEQHQQASDSPPQHHASALPHPPPTSSPSSHLSPAYPTLDSSSAPPQQSGTQEQACGQGGPQLLAVCNPFLPCSSSSTSAERLARGLTRPEHEWMLQELARLRGAYLLGEREFVRADVDLTGLEAQVIPRGGGCSLGAHV